ncbi:UNVERIFIED_CONTAM: hypothetical protein Sradi_2318900 [Sesamum radiatum]|uniref:Uncharacterized protein n=1 Tax=Sesamum radiatum TaxID=300843 RepID=A0AAW2T4E7_SESRA
MSLIEIESWNDVLRHTKNLMVLAKVENHENPNTVDLDWCSFHVLIHDLPIGRMTKEIAEFIGNKLGRFMDIDTDNNGGTWGAVLRIQVMMDVTRPLNVL